MKAFRPGGCFGHSTVKFLYLIESNEVSEERSEKSSSSDIVLSVLSIDRILDERLIAISMLAKHCAKVNIVYGQDEESIPWNADLIVVARRL